MGVRQRRQGCPSRSYTSRRAPPRREYRPPVARLITALIADSSRRLAATSNDDAAVRGSILARQSDSDA